MTRPARARIDLSALQHNLSLAKQAAAGSRVMAVVKANGYGHGLLPVAQALGAADALAVASIEEALVLREAGINKPVVLLEGVFSQAEWQVVSQLRLQAVIHHDIQIDWLEQATLSDRLRVWLKVDTGMHRLGIAPARAQTCYQRLSAIAALAGEPGWMSHLACADEPHRPETSQQIGCFEQVVNGQPGERSLANSAALLTRSDSHFDWVRPGIMLYGSSPLARYEACPVALSPVMTLSTALIAVHKRQRGEAVGYGGNYICESDMRVGVAAIGYGDGYPRHAPTGTPVLVNGQRCRLVGRVSMDMITLDLSEQPEARPGDPVILWGEGLCVDEIADHAGTIGYELLCNITPRVPREYVNETL